MRNAKGRLRLRKEGTMIDAVQRWPNQELSGKVGSEREEGDERADKDLLESVFLLLYLIQKQKSQEWLVDRQGNK